MIVFEYNFYTTTNVQNKVISYPHTIVYKRLILLAVIVPITALHEVT